MLILKPMEICKYKNICPYSSNCYGIDKDRKTTFSCDYISFENGEPYFPRNKNLSKGEFNLNDSNKKILHG